MGRKNSPSAFDENGMKAPAEVRSLCLKVAEQAGKDQWWNALAYASQLVAACQKGCSKEIAKVVKKRTSPR
jgi:hypothetical protein